MHLFIFQLLGIGCSPNPELALDTLYNVSCSNPGKNWKSTTTIGFLYEALEINVPSERKRNFKIFTLTACAISQFPEQILKLGICNVREQASETHRLPAYAELNETQALREDVSLEIDGFLPLARSSRNENTRKLEQLELLLLAAAAYGELSIVKDLIETKGTPIECTTWRKETPLFLACRYGHIDVVEYLLSRNANAATSNEFGENCLYWISSFEPDDMDRVADQLWEAKPPLKHVVYGNDMFEKLIVQDEFLNTGYVFGSPLLRAM
jgi:hypothetical protein